MAVQAISRYFHGYAVDLRDFICSMKLLSIKVDQREYRNSEQIDRDVVFACKPQPLGAEHEI